MHSTETRSTSRAPTALVVVNGDDVHEDLFTAASELQAAVTEEGFVARTGVGTARFAEGTDDDLVVLCTALGEFTADARAGLARAVARGTGLLALHATNVPSSPPDRPAAADLLLSGLIGSRYVSHGPPPHESTFTAVTDPDHELTAGVEPFEVTHEHYHLAVADTARVVAWREAGAGTEPLVHVRDHGRGRVCYLQFGHDMRVWHEPAVRRLVRRAARWACCREATGAAS